MTPWQRALLVTLIIEVPLVAAAFPGQRLKMAGVALLMNIATNLLLNLVLPQLPLLRGHHLLVGELIAVLAEAAAYALASRPRDLPRSLLVSCAANAASFAAGLLPLWRFAI